MKRLVFIDRDGVINRDLWGYVTRWEDFEFMPGVLDSFKKLKENGIAAIVISNQAGIGDGTFTQEELNVVNEHMLKEVNAHGGSIAATYYCVHGKTTGCDCRKPKFGLFEQASADYSFDKKTTYFIGDKLSDIEAGIRYGLKTIMVLTGYGEKQQHEVTDEIKPDYVVKDLSEAVDLVLKEYAS